MPERESEMKCVLPDIFSLVAGSYLTVVDPASIPKEVQEHILKEAQKICPESCPDAITFDFSQNTARVSCAPTKEVKNA
jgi:hypothetical protein